MLNLGLEHTNRKGKKIKSKQMGAPCKCKKKCSEKVSEEVRKEIFDEYWGLGDHSRQWDFIARYVKIFDKKVSTNSSSSRRQISNKYFLPLKNKEIQCVCKVMFLNTLAISEKVVSNVGKRLELSPAIVADKRGTHTNRPHKIHSEVIACIKKHIDMFPVVDSHYTRQNTTKQ